MSRLYPRRRFQRLVSPRCHAMEKLMPFLAVLAALMCGCAHEQLSKGRDGVQLTEGQGDVGLFILRKSIQYHCTPVRTNSLPAVSGAWYCLENDSEAQKSVLVVMSQDRFAEIVAFLREAFGQLSIGPEDMGGAGFMGSIRLADRASPGLSFGAAHEEHRLLS